MQRQVLSGLFKGAQLRKARRALGLSERDLANKLGVPLDVFLAWEEGLSCPEPDELEYLARALTIGVEYLLRDTPEVPTGAYYRVANLVEPLQLSPATREVVFRFYELCRYQADLEKILGRGTPSNAPLVELVDPEQAAQQTRQALGLQATPIRDAESFLTDQGVKVFYLEVKGREFAGMSVWTNELGPAVLVEESDPHYRKRFTSVHEYAHILRWRENLRQPTVCNLDWDTSEEQFANQFSAAMLVPREDRYLWKFSTEHNVLEIRPEDLDPLCGRYGVSREVVARRLAELEMAPPELVREVQASRTGPPASYGRGSRPRWQRRLSRKYLRLASEAHSKGLISLGKFAQYLGVDTETALEVAVG